MKNNDNPSVILTEGRTDKNLNSGRAEESLSDSERDPSVSLRFSRDDRLKKIAWILVSLLFGLMCILPSILFRFELGSRFQGIQLQATDAEYHYAARVREIQDGFPKLGNVFYPDEKNQPYLQPPLPEWTVAHLGNLFGPNAAQALLLSQFLFGIMVAAIMIGCLWSLTERFWASLITVTIFLFVGFLFSDPFAPFKLLKNTQGTLEFLPFSRPINPQWSASLFFGAIWAISSWWRSRSRLPLVIAALLTIFSVYSYVYVWTILGAFVGCLFLYLLFSQFCHPGAGRDPSHGILDPGLRRDDSKTRIVDLLAYGLIVLLGSIPYLINVWQASHHEFYAETSMRLGLLHTHRPIIGLSVIALLIIVLLIRRLFPQTWTLLACLALACVIAINQQIVTGVAVAAPHYHWYFVKPLFALFLMVGVLSSDWFIKYWSKMSPSIQKILFVAMGLFVLIFSFLYQLRSTQAWTPFWAEQQSAAAVLRKIDETLRPGDVVYAQGFIRDLIPVYTSADVFWATNAYAYLSSDEQARQAYFFDLWLQGVTPEQVAQEFPTTRRAELSSRIHAVYYRELTGAYKHLPDQEVEEAIQAYQKYVSFHLNLFPASPDDCERSNPSSVLDCELFDPLPGKLNFSPPHYFLISIHDTQTPALQSLKDVSEIVYQDEVYELRKMVR